jgi:hypothetical protein
VVSSQFGWSDLGSFESVYDYLVSIGHPVDENGNMVIGTDNYTAFIGMKDTIFVYTPTANLILKKIFTGCVCIMHLQRFQFIELKLCCSLSSRSAAAEESYK